MSKLFVFLGLAITGCGTESGKAMFLANIDASAAPSTVFVEVYFASGAPGSMPVATPDILAGTAPSATTAMIWAGRSMSAGYHGQPVGFFPGGELGHPMYVGAIGLTDTGISGGAWSGPIDHPEDAMVELKLDPGLLPEVWGTQSEAGKCFRLNTGAATVFVTRAEDPDCDGLTGAQDTQPYAYCDPKATGGAAADACQ